MIHDSKFTRYIEPTSPDICMMLQTTRAPVFYNERTLSSRAAAAYLGVSMRTLARMRAQGRSPAYHKADGKFGKIAYAESGLAEYKQAVLPWISITNSRKTGLRQTGFAFLM